MDYTLDHTHQDYIRMTVSGFMNKHDLLEAMKELITHPDYSTKHTLWDMTDVDRGTIGMADVKEIIGFLRLYKPKEKNFANKSVFFVSNDMNKAFIDLFITMSKMLPFKYKVYTSEDEAVAYLTGA